MSDVNRYRAMVEISVLADREYHTVVLAADHDALLAARDAQVAECEKDAARYRWLRTRIGYSDETFGTAVQYRARVWSHHSSDLVADTIDEAIDGQGQPRSAALSAAAGEPT